MYISDKLQWVFHAFAKRTMLHFFATIVFFVVPFVFFLGVYCNATHTPIMGTRKGEKEKNYFSWVCYTS